MLLFERIFYIILQTVDVEIYSVIRIKPNPTIELDIWNYMYYTFLDFNSIRYRA